MASSEKYLVGTGDATFAVRWHRGRADVGGYGRVMTPMEAFVQDYLGKEPPEPSWPQENRARYRVGCTRGEFRRAIAEARDHGLSVEAVTSIGRVW